jgi:hypothetical protein
MALTNILVTNEEHFTYGGVKYIELAAGGDYDIAVSTSGVATVDTWQNEVRLEFEKETAKMTINSSHNETTFRGFEVTIEGYFPGLSVSNLQALENFLDENQSVVAKVFMWDGGNDTDSAEDAWIIGWDNVTCEDEQNTLHGLRLASIEFDSGAGLSDQNGATLKFSCVMGMFPGRIPA